MGKSALLLASSLCINLAVLSTFAAPGMLAYQCFLWLRDGFWTEYPIWLLLEAVGIGWPHVQYAGVQKIIDFIVELPTSIGLFPILPALLIAAVMVLDNTADDLPDRDAPKR